MGGIVDAIVGAVTGIIDAVVDLVEAVVDLVVDIVEAVVDLIASLLGFEDQVVTLFEVHNQPLFSDAQKDQTSLTTIILESMLQDIGITENVLYYATQRNLKTDLGKLVQYIDDGNYIEDFADIESFIFYVNSDEIYDVLVSIENAPVTVTSERLFALTIYEWVSYWLATNKGMSYDTFTWDETIDGAVRTLTVNAGLAEYNDATNDYTVVAQYDDVDPVTGDPIVVDYPITVDSKPTGLHYIVRYYVDSDPTTTKFFIYKVGDGLYTDLDNPNTSIDIDADAIKAIPPIPLRVNNTNYTSRPQDEVDKIEGIGKFIGLEIPDVLDGVMSDPNVVGQEDKVDHVYLNFGIRLADTTHPAKKYMYNVCQNLFPSQAVTQAIYNNAVDGSDKPQNNIIITANEYKYLFQWSYITYHNYTVAEIDADPNSDINGYYYSDLSKFDANGDLKVVYYVSSRQGTYNVQYIAKSVDDIDAFIAGTLPSEVNYNSSAAGWIQSTTKFRWTNGIIYEADGTTVYRDDYIRPTLVYEKVGSNLKLVNSVPESVTVNQEISYYRCAADGMTGYTIKAPIGAFRVVDAATGEFKMVKFNLANENDLMFPLLFDKIEGLSQAEVTQIFTAAAHVSMYVAHVEVIEVSFWQKLLAVVIFVIIIYFAWQFATEFMAAYEAGTTTAFLQTTVQNLAANFAKQMIIRYVAQEVAGDNPVLAALIMVGGQFVDFGFGDTLELSKLGASDYAQLFAFGADGMSNVYLKRVDEGYQDLQLEQEAAEKRRQELTDQLTNARQLLGPAYSNPAFENVGLYTIETAWTTDLNPQLPEFYLSSSTNLKFEALGSSLDAGLIYDQIFNLEDRLYAA